MAALLSPGCDHSAADHTYAFTGYRAEEAPPMEPAPPPPAEPPAEERCGPMPPTPPGCEATCVGGEWVPRADPPPEVCNGADDDCDGRVDERLSGLCCAGDLAPPCNGLDGRVLPGDWIYAPPQEATGPLLVQPFEVTRARWSRYAGHVTPPGAAGEEDDKPVRSVDLFTALALANAVALGLPGGEPCYRIDDGQLVGFEDLEGLHEGRLGPVTFDRDCAGPRLPTRTEFGRLLAAGWASVEAEECVRCPATVCGHAWCACNTQGVVRPVGELEPNALGIYDLVGNVAEWVWPDGQLRVDAVDTPWPVAGGSVSGNEELSCGAGESELPPDGALPAWSAVSGKYLFTGIRLVWATTPADR